MVHVHYVMSDGVWCMVHVHYVMSDGARVWCTFIM